MAVAAFGGVVVAPALRERYSERAEDANNAPPWLDSYCSCGKDRWPSGDGRGLGPWLVEGMNGRIGLL